MDPLKQCVLVALVLLEVAVSAEYGEKTNCEVTGVMGLEVSVECGGFIYRATVQTVFTREDDEAGEATIAVYTEGEKNQTVEGDFQENPDSYKTIANNSFDDELGNVTRSLNSYQVDNDTEEVVKNISFDGNSCNMTDGKSKSENVEPSKRFAHSQDNNTSARSSHQWLNITTVRVNLLGNVSTLDLSYFSSTKNLILNTQGFALCKVFGVNNLTNLEIKSAKVKGISFIQNLTNIKSLNLSRNNIEAIPILDLPTSIILLDLSYNNISFNTNTCLPQSLQVLNVSYNSMKSTESIILKGNLIILDMRGNLLVHVPCLNMSSLEELYLSENNIAVLQDGSFKNLNSLTILDLRKNCLKTLEEKVFEGLNKLQMLDMSENNVVTLAPAIFQYLNNLVRLSLSGNINLGNLQDIEDASFLFGTGQRLQVIEASRTNLTKIPSTLTRSVKQLLLAENAIESIQCGELDSFPLLQVMDVSKNFITDIEEDALGRLDFLFHLLLSGNKLTNVPKSLPDELKVLDLRCNSIKKLNNYDFLGLQKLQVLLLSRNKITVVEDGAFGQLSSLDVLDLSHNPIKSLSRTSFIGPRKLKEIYLISLTDLIPLQEPLSFPAPESAHLEVLNMESSPVLATQLMDDVAALTMFHELFELNLNHCRLSTLRSDLPKYLPRLHKLELTGNVLNCTNIIWLVKWLQALNISMQDPGKFRREIYNLKDMCCEEVKDTNSYDEATVICASPEYLSGKQISSLKEEDFPDLKLTSSTLPPARQVIITEPYRAQTLAGSEHNTSSSVSDKIDYSSQTTLSFYNSTNSSFKDLPPFKSTTPSSHLSDFHSHIHEIKYEPFKNKSPKISFEKTKNIFNKFNQTSHQWKYLKNETEYKLSTIDPEIVLLNDTRVIDSDIDNHLNGSISSGAYLTHELPPASHPGMVVFLLVVCMILIATSAMVYSQCLQARQEREYQHHQDIEVSSLGGNDLW